MSFSVNFLLATFLGLQPGQQDVKSIDTSLLYRCWYIVVVVQSLRTVWFFATPWTAACQVFLSFTISQSLLKLMSIESVIPANHLILCSSLILLPSIFPSIKGFSNESVLRIRWPNYWSFNFSISPSNEYLELISFRIDWLFLVAVQRLFFFFLFLNFTKLY